jgi:hypothetical protein
VETEFLLPAFSDAGADETAVDAEGRDAYTLAKNWCAPGTADFLNQRT